MRNAIVGLAGLALSGCATVPEGADVLTGDALAARLSGQEMRLRPPEDDPFEGLVLIAQFRANGAAAMSGEADGQPIEMFTDTERWQVRGQDLCVFEGQTPEDGDCIRVDWITADRVQLTEVKSDGALETSLATLTPL